MSDQLDLDDFVRQSTHRADPDTARAAATLIHGKLGELQGRVVEAYAKHGPMSARKAERLVEFYSYAPSTIRKRISELAKSGTLIEAGIDRTGRAPCTIYVLRTTSQSGVTDDAS